MRKPSKPNTVKPRKEATTTAAIPATPVPVFKKPFARNKPKK
jgi:hypothetical protein